MTDLTPYDTGERAEPKIWPVLPGEPDTYGRVDFEDDESKTVVTVHVAYDSEAGGYTVFVYPHDEVSVHVQMDHEVEPIDDIEGRVVEELSE